MRATARIDRDAFVDLYDGHCAVAYRLALSVTRDSLLAEAVVQDVFLAVWCQLERFDERRARPVSWLLAITHHKAVDAVRREQLRRAEPAELMAEIADERVDLVREAWLGVQREQVRSAVASLTERQREVIELAYYGGYSQAQLALILEQPLGTVKSRTHAALARLRASLEDDGITAEIALAAG
jgi:RNA polymerase sigma-70 factor (ECF subfamily)